MEKLVCKKPNKSVVDFVLKELGELNFNSVQKLLRKKDIKINGKRINKDCAINSGDIVEVYALANQNSKDIEILFSDSNIIVANKPTDIEVVSQTGDDLLCKLQTQLNANLYAVHRIDRNTTGLVVFAKTQQAKLMLEQGFKKHLIKKYYLAVVVGKPTKESDKLIAYHKKDSQTATCFISDTPKLDHTKIITSYKVLKSNDILSLLEVQIETGKTHQIRAHLAHIGYPVLGDEKYGNKAVNKQYKKKKQMLIAYKLDFSQIAKNFNIALKQIELPLAKDNLFNAL